MLARIIREMMPSTAQPNITVGNTRCGTAFLNNDQSPGANASIVYRPVTVSGGLSAGSSRPAPGSQENRPEKM